MQAFGGTTIADRIEKCDSHSVLRNYRTAVLLADVHGHRVDVVVDGTASLQAPSATPSSVQTAGVKSLSSQAPCPRPTAPAWRQGATDTTSLRQTRVTLRPLPALSPHGTGAPTRAGSGHCQCEWYSLRKDTPAERSGEIDGMGDRHAALVSIPSTRKSHSVSWPRFVD